MPVEALLSGVSSVGESVVLWFSKHTMSYSRERLDVEVFYESLLVHVNIYTVSKFSPALRVLTKSRE